MKKIFIIGFRGVGFSKTQHPNELALIKAGHVGFAFEGEEDVIFGFHPTENAIQNIGGEEAAIEWLKAQQRLDGAIQVDTPIFLRAHTLAKAEARTEVWQIEIVVSDEDFDRISTLVTEWFESGKIFPYSFPNADPETDNCATFPRKFGLPLPEETGQLRDYIKVLEKQGKRWYPRVKSDDDKNG